MTTDIARLPPLPDSTPDPLARGIFDGFRARGKRVLNLHRTLAYSPRIPLAQQAVIEAIRTETKAPQAMIELGILRAAQIVGCEYEFVQHIPLSIKAGLTRAQVDAVAGWRDSTVFDARARAVLGWVEAISTHLGEVDDAHFAELSRHFSSQEIFEITFTACLYFGTGMMMKALRIQLEPEAWAAAEKA